MQVTAVLENRIKKLENIVWQKLVFLQDDNFKISTEEEYNKVAASLLNKHFIAPFYVWESEDTLYCLDGKRRETILKRIAQEGGVTCQGTFHAFAIPEELPALFIQADTMQEAASYVLAYSSTYGTITNEGLHDFLQKFDLDYFQQSHEINLPDFSEQRFEQKFDVYGVKENVAEMSEEEAKEIMEGTATILVKKGDMFRLGTATLICGDSLERETFEQLMGNDRARMVYTDPPYNIPYESFGGKGKIQHTDFAMGAGEMSHQEFAHDFLRVYMANVVAFSVDGSLHYHWMDFRHVWHVCEAANHPETYKTPEPKQICVWNKSVMANGAFYRAKHEFCLIFKNGTAKHTSHLELQNRTRANVWDYQSANSFGSSDRERENNVPTGVGMLEAHPTPKPVEMACDAILDVTDEGDVVLDCFSGSGSTLVACLETNRKFYGVEFEEKYVQLIINRYLKYCDKKGLVPIFEHLNGELTLNDFINGTTRASTGTTTDREQ